MRIGHLVLQEIRYRKLNFALGVLSVVAAVGCSIAMLTVLRKHDLRTGQIVQEKQQAMRTLMSRMEDEYRKITKRMGFNMIILPQNQSVGEYYADGVGSRLMPEEYGDKLAARKLLSINHVTPVLQQRMHWKELDRPILLTGVKGAVYIQSKLQTPIQENVPPGAIVLGHEVRRGANLKAGDQVTLAGRQFTVKGFQPGRGNKDDIAVWINLADAQAILNKPGQINGILALECLNCGKAGFEAVRKEVSAILPDTQIVEFAAMADVRTDARVQAAAAARAANDQEVQHRKRISAEQRKLAAVLIPVILAAAAVWIAFLTFTNVRDRGSEIGILRALGLRSRDVLLIFLAKAIVIGLAGALAGYVLGALVGMSWGDEQALIKAVHAGWLLAALIGAPVLAAFASALPAAAAAWQDPAVLLRDD